MTNQLLGRPLRFGDVEQIAAIKQMKEAQEKDKNFLVTAKYLEIIEVQRMSVFQVFAENATKAEEETINRLSARYEKQKNIDIEFLEFIIVETKREPPKDTRTLELFKKQRE